MSWLPKLMENRRVPKQWEKRKQVLPVCLLRHPYPDKYPRVSIFFVLEYSCGILWRRCGCAVYYYISVIQISNAVILCYHNSIWTYLFFSNLGCSCGKSCLYFVSIPSSLQLNMIYSSEAGMMNVYLGLHLWKCAPPGTLTEHFWSSASFLLSPLQPQESFSLWKASVDLSDASDEASQDLADPHC